MMELNRLFDTMDRVHENATINAVFGPPTQVEGKTIIPIGRVAYGFGLSFGQGTAPSEGQLETMESAEGDVDGHGRRAGWRSGGGGLGVRPLAVLEVTPEATTITSIVDTREKSMMVMCAVGWSVFWLARALIKVFGKK